MVLERWLRLTNITWNRIRSESAGKNNSPPDNPVMIRLVWNPVTPILRHLPSPLAVHFYDVLIRVFTSVF